MPRTFHRSANTLARLSIFGSAFLLVGLGWVLVTLDRSPYVTQAGIARRQPVPFSHEHHVGGLGIDCRYCHTTVELGRLYWHFVDIVWIFLFPLLYLIDLHA